MSQGRSLPPVQGCASKPTLLHRAIDIKSNDVTLNYMNLILNERTIEFIPLHRKSCGRHIICDDKNYERHVVTLAAQLHKKLDNIICNEHNDAFIGGCQAKIFTGQKTYIKCPYGPCDESGLFCEDHFWISRMGHDIYKIKIQFLVLFGICFYDGTDEFHIAGHMCGTRVFDHLLAWKSKFLNYEMVRDGRLTPHHKYYLNGNDYIDEVKRALILYRNEFIEEGIEAKNSEDNWPDVVDSDEACYEKGYEWQDISKYY